MYLLRNTDHPSVPAATREMAAFPDRVLDLLPDSCFGLTGRRRASV